MDQVGSPQPVTQDCQHYIVHVVHQLVCRGVREPPGQTWWWLPDLPAAGSGWCLGGQQRSSGAGANSACTMRAESAAEHAPERQPNAMLKRMHAPQQQACCSG